MAEIKHTGLEGAFGRVEGLDDPLTLIKQIRGLLSRLEESVAGQPINLKEGGVQRSSSFLYKIINPRTSEISIDGHEPVYLDPRTFLTMEYLAQYPNEVVPRLEMIKRLGFPSEGAMNSNICRLRKTIRDAGLASYLWIETIGKGRSGGYKLAVREYSGK